MNDRGENPLNNLPVLTVESVGKAFGGVQALWNVSFTVDAQTVQGVIGPNGAGKTTLFNLITGIYVPNDGEIFFNQSRINGKKVHELVAYGISRTFQNVELFKSMTAIENVMVGQYVRTNCGFWGAILRWPRVFREEKRSRQKAMELLEFVGLGEYADSRSEDLPFGWQRLLEIARALASQPTLLLLDEPAAGLNAVETKRLGALIQDIRNQGTTVLLVEHDMNLTMRVSDRIVVLDQGQLIAEGTPREVQSNETVMAAYLGKTGILNSE
jgi:branched-chain amino acid transport system ATP-binding protein